MNWEGPPPTAVPPCPHGKPSREGCAICSPPHPDLEEMAEAADVADLDESEVDLEDKGLVSPKAAVTGLYRGHVEYDD